MVSLSNHIERKSFFLNEFVYFEPSFAEASEARRAFTPELAEGSVRTEKINFQYILPRQKKIAATKKHAILLCNINKYMKG
jgi:hypothetical protein